MSSAAANLRILHLEVDPSQGDGDYRILVDNTMVKYISIDGGNSDTDDMCFPPVLIPMLPAFPGGEWNTGQVSKDMSSDRPTYICLDKERNTSHNRSFVASSMAPKFPSPTIAKFARFPWEINYFDHETEAYRWIEGKGLEPKFLGHLTEEGRIIGFLLEKVEGRRACPDDLKLCQAITSKLHHLGILHRDLNRHNFIVNSDSVVLVDFECARRCQDTQLFEQEPISLERQLNDESGRGGFIPNTSDVAS
ncbi:MAG: hypothetical protein M1816_001301 [Peltula sp. TS41687]|nr:MAG: hypothetical protein M1816_001301 [Peltula sp. TS41687]